MHDLLSRRSMRGCRLIHSPATALVFPVLLSLVTGCQDPAAPTLANLNALPPTANLEAAVNADGTGSPVNLTKTPDTGELSPRWSSDGSKITFSARAFDGRSSDIYVMNADGSGVTQVARSSGSDQKPTWRP